jgi:hypothetical protein
LSPYFEKEFCARQLKGIVKIFAGFASPETSGRGAAGAFQNQQFAIK